MKKYILAVITGILAAGYVSAERVGTTGAQFLKIEPSARPMAMGGAFSAIADDSSAVFYNPAGIASQERKQYSGTYVRYFQDIGYGSLSGVVYSWDKGALGVGVNYLDSGTLEKRGPDDVFDPDGRTYSPDTFKAIDTALTLSYARRNPLPHILEGMDMGVNFRTIYQMIDSYTALSFMVDAGALYPLDNKLNLSLVIQNIGFGVKYKDDRDPLPLNIRVGAAYFSGDGLNLAFESSNYLVDNLFYLSLGAEYWIRGMLALRVGYKYGYDTDSLGGIVGLSAGLGVRFSDFGLDYAWAPFGTLGNTHRISFLMNM